MSNRSARSFRIIFTSLLLSASVLLSGCAAGTASAGAAASASPSASASAAAGSEPAVSREYAVSEMVQSIGRNRLSPSAYILSTYPDCKDIDGNYIEDYQKAAAAGIVHTDTDNPLRPKEDVKRIEALVMFSRIVPDTSAAKVQDARAYSDTPDWARDDIERLSEAGLLNDYTGDTLGADDRMTAADIRKLTDVSDEMYNTVSAGESFYGYINNKTFRNVSMDGYDTLDCIHGAVIQSSSAWSHFSDIGMNISSEEQELLSKLMDGTMTYEKGTAEQRVHDMLECIADSSVLKDSDRKLLASYRSRITDAKDISSLIAASASLYNEAGVATLYSITAQPDPETNIMYPTFSLVSAGAAGMLSFYSYANEQYGVAYQEIMKEFAAAAGMAMADDEIAEAISLQQASCADTSYIKTYLAGLKMRGYYDPTYDSTRMQEDIQKILAEHPELDPDTGEYLSPVYGLYANADADSLYPDVKATDIVNAVGYHDYDHVMISAKRSLEETLPHLADEKNLNALKLNALLNLDLAMGATGNDAEDSAIARISGLQESASMLEPYDEKSIAGGSVMDMIRSSAAEGGPLNEYALLLLASCLPGDVGMIYVHHYYDDSTSDEIARMVTDIWNAYLARFEKNDWMSDATKQAAEEKIHSMIAVIGYPDNLEDPVITPESEGGTMLSNLQSIQLNKLKISIRDVAEKDYDRTMMAFSPDTVNANYDPGKNTINIYAGILNSPIYDPSRTYAQNLGAIGMVVAHEIGHAFDAQGAKFDANGCLRNWWTDEDLAAFQERQKSFIEYYRQFQIVEGVTQDSEVTITENMADVAGIQCVMDVVGDDPEAQKEALESFASMWAQLGTEKALTSKSLLADVHSGNQVRVNACVSTLDAFYRIYGVREGDPMYVAPESRLKLW